MKGSKKIVSLRDHKNMMDLMKQLYGNDEVKDDNKVGSAQGICGTKSPGVVAKVSSEVKETLFEE